MKLINTALPKSFRLRKLLSGLLSSRWSMPLGGVTRYFEIVPQSAAPQGAILMIASLSLVIQFPVIAAGAAIAAVAAQAANAIPKPNDRIVLRIDMLPKLLSRLSKLHFAKQRNCVRLTGC
jgi:hypothetical protein